KKEQMVVSAIASTPHCYLSFLIISGAFVTQYIRTKKKLAKVGNSLIGLMFVGFAARLATLQS
ncbi:TPA: LysE family transporter, partial [Escherichia coli]|nr:LysE family transporter [Escherichia coli]HAI9168276.1 LysE family transporter [Escherichia coli]